MSNANLFKQLGVDENLKPLPIKVKQQPLDKYYKATFTPDFPPIPRFEPNVFIYASLTDESVSAIGRYLTQDDFYQIAIIFGRKLQSGTYPIKKGEGSHVLASVISTGGWLHGGNGEIKLLRDNIKESIFADFNFEIESGEKSYKVKGTLELLATGPL